MNTKTQQLIVPAVLSLFLATPASLAAGGNHNPPPPPTTTNTFTATGSMNVPRRQHQTIPLGNGQVLAVTGDGTGANTAELYNPATGTWAFTGTPAVFHEGGTVTLLANGEVLLAGGASYTSSGSFVPTA